MEVLLLENIPGIGQCNDIIVVKEGFALNNLLPRRRALVATPTVRKRYAEQIRRRAEEKVREIELARSLTGAIGGKTVVIKARSSKTGKLYAAITAAEVSTAIKEQISADVTADSIVFSEPIKAIGDHTVKITVAHQQAELRVKVEAVE